MSRTVLLRSVLLGGHVRTDVYMGPTGGTPAGLGGLVNDIEGYRWLRDVIVRGVPEGEVCIVAEGTSLEEALEEATS